MCFFNKYSATPGVIYKKMTSFEKAANYAITCNLVEIHMNGTSDAILKTFFPNESIHPKLGSAIHMTLREADVYAPTGRRLTLAEFKKGFFEQKKISLVMETEARPVHLIIAGLIKKSPSEIYNQGMLEINTFLEGVEDSKKEEQKRAAMNVLENFIRGIGHSEVLGKPELVPLPRPEPEPVPKPEVKPSPPKGLAPVVKPTAPPALSDEAINNLIFLRDNPFSNRLIGEIFGAIEDEWDGIEDNKLAVAATFNRLVARRGAQVFNKIL